VVSVFVRCDHLYGFGVSGGAKEASKGGFEEVAVAKMVSRVAVALVVMALCLGLAGCTEENPAIGTNNGNNGANNGANNGVSDAVGGEDTDEDEDVSVDDDVTSDDDGGTVVDTGDPEDTDDPGDTASEDVEDPQDTVVEDTTTEDSSTEPDTRDDTGEADATVDGGQTSCGSNADCSGGQICCENFQTNTKLCYDRSQCNSGGICQSDSECASGEGCCQLDPRLTDKRCSTQCGDTTNDCTVNSDCAGFGTVCCPSFDGTAPGECVTRNQCQVSGLCSSGNDCRPGENCCSVTFNGQTYNICSTRC
jgi:hypothetical protein